MPESRPGDEDGRCKSHMGLHIWTLQHPVRWDSAPRIADRRVHFPYLGGSRNRARAPSGSSGLAVRRRISGGDFIISACLFHNCSPRVNLFDLLKSSGTLTFVVPFFVHFIYTCVWRLFRYSSYIPVRSLIFPPLRSLPRYIIKT